MTRIVVTFALVLTVLATFQPAEAAQKREQKREQKRAYKPAERRQAAQPSNASAQASDGAAPSATYEQELQEARARRDRQLSDAAAGEADQRSLEKKKQEIFAQYAAIVAALRDKYEAAHSDDTAVAPKPGKTRPRSRYDNAKGSDVGADRGASKTGKNDKGRGSANALGAAQEKLAEENARHASRIEELNAQLRDAESSDNPRDVRRIRKAIEKENNSYGARKAILERKIQDLGGSVTPPAPPAAAE